jgi:SAM-dependent methyltransferase
MQSPQFQLHAEIEQRHWWFVGRRRIMTGLVKTILPPSPDRLVIDVGCGTGANIAALADHYACVGIDASAEAIHLARERFPQVQFRQGSAPEDLGDWMDQAKLFLLMDVLEHLRDDFEFLSRILSASAPGCLFFITVPADESLWTRHDESFGHYRRYEKRRLERLWEDLPVTPLLVSFFNSRLLPAIRLVRTVSRWRDKPLGPAGTDLWLPAPPLNLILENIFAGEIRRLLKTYARKNRGGYPRGLSLIAVLLRESGPISPRIRPADVVPDRHHPSVLPLP